MLINPQIGQRVVFTDRGVGEPYNRLVGKVGTIVAIIDPPPQHPSYPPEIEAVLVQFDGEPFPGSTSPLSFWISRFSPFDPLAQERIEDQQRREAHADKYL